MWRWSGEVGRKRLLPYLRHEVLLLSRIWPMHFLPPLWASAHCLSRPFSAVLPWLTSQQWASVSVEPWTVMCDWSGPLCCPGRGGWIGHPWFRCPLPVFSTQRGRSVASWYKVGPSRLPSQKQLWTKPFSLEGASQAQWLTSLVPRDT